MALEIERKFLVKNDDWKSLADAGTPIGQGYLRADEHCTVRVRLASDRGFLTIKGASEGIAREEYEYEIPAAEAARMLESLCRGFPILKTRYRLHLGPHLWEIDVFEGENAGLVVAEIELDSEDEAFLRPDWLGAEVSGDARYYNACLSRTPYRRWNQP